MSIENNLKRIADALEGINDKLSYFNGAAETVATPVQAPAAAPASAEVPAAPAPAPAPAATAPVQPVAAAVPAAPAPAPAPQPAEAATVEMSPEDLNAALVEHAGRLGGPERIFDLMKAAPFNAVGIADLAKEQYAPLIEAVKALS